MLSLEDPSCPLWGQELASMSMKRCSHWFLPRSNRVGKMPCCLFRKDQAAQGLKGSHQLNLLPSNYSLFLDPIKKRQFCGCNYLVGSIVVQLVSVSCSDMTKPPSCRTLVNHLPALSPMSKALNWLPTVIAGCWFGYKISLGLHMA